MTHKDDEHSITKYTLTYCNQRIINFNIKGNVIIRYYFEFLKKVTILTCNY